jgi:hypothetical protein
MKTNRSWWGRLAWTIAGILALFSFILFNQAYRFTHFDAEAPAIPNGPPSALLIARYGLPGQPAPCGWPGT